MTQQYGYNLLHIGQLAIIDTDEREYHANGENLEVVVGKSFTDGLKIVEVIANDVNGDRVLNEDTEYYTNGRIAGRNNETLQYDKGAGPQESALDYSALVNVTITAGDGSTRTVDLVLTQLRNGDTFLGEPSSNEAALDNIKIHSVRINRVVTENSNGDTLGNSRIRNSETVCFTVGTSIATPDGTACVEALRPGDAVLTRDGQSRIVLWTGGMRFDRDDLERRPELRPIAIAPGALGPGTPERTLRVSAQHRILVRSAIAERMFGAAELLVPACKLTGWPGIDVDTSCQEVEYVHILCEGHQVIWAEGAAAETLYLGPGAVAALSPAAMAEIAAIVPQVLQPGFRPAPVRRLVERRRRIDRLIARHVRNDQPLCAPVP